jgi:hypothetical protein
MRNPLIVFLLGTMLFVVTVFAQDPTGEHNCPSVTGAGGGLEAEPAYVGSGGNGFSRNQSLCLPQLAPLGSGASPVAFIVQGVEPGIRVDSQGTIYVESIRGVPGGVDLWRWDQSLDFGPNTAAGVEGTLPFKYEGQPDNCGIFAATGGSCAQNVGFVGNPGVAPGGGDCDIAVNSPSNSGVPNLALTSLTLAPGFTATNSSNRGDTFFTPNVVAALIPGDDRMWNDAPEDPSTVYVNYHDVGTFNIEVQRSNNGGLTYLNGVGEAIDPQTFPAAGGVPATNSANVAGQIKIDKNHNSCSSHGNLYVVFVAPDNVTENLAGGPLRSVYVGASTDVNLGLPVFTFTDYKVFTSPSGSAGATNGTDQVFPALAVDDFGYLYAVWSDNTNIYFSSSSNQGATWRTAPVQVNQEGADGKARVFPWVAADAFGHVVVTWLGADKVGNSNDPTAMAGAQWQVYAAESINGNSTTPTFNQYTASDHVVHYGTVCTVGTACSSTDSRSLADFFQVALDPQHRINIAYADDHDTSNHHVGVPYFTYQLQANQNIVTTGSCAGSPPPPPPGAHKITGGGRIGAPINFGFIAQDTPAHAELSYHDSNANADVHSSNVTVPTVGFSGNCSTFKGSAKYNQQSGYNYTANACDNGDPSSSGAGKDTFFLTVTNALGQVVYQNGGTITSGDIELHNQ